MNRRIFGHWLTALMAGFAMLATSLAAAQSLRMVPEIGHTDGANSASFSPNGKWIVTSSRDGTAKVWSASRGREVLTLTGHTRGVNSASFSPDGTRVITASDDGTAHVYEAATGKLILKLVGHEEEVESACFSPDGTRIVTSSMDRTAKVWNAATGDALVSLPEQPNILECASFSPDGTMFVTGSADNSAKVWDAVSGKGLLTLVGHTDSVNSANFSPDGKLIVTASADGTTRVWDAATGKPFENLPTHKGWVKSATFSSDGKLIVAACEDGTTMVCTVADGKEILNLTNHTGAANSAAFSPRDDRLVVASDTVTAWSLATGKPVANLSGHADGIFSTSFSSDGAKVVVAYGGHAAIVWNIANGKPLVSLNDPAGGVYSASFSPEGSRVVTASADNSAKIWDALTGKLLLSLKGHTQFIYSPSFSPDGTRVVAASADRYAIVWGASSGNELMTLDGGGLGMGFAAFSPDGRRIVTASFPHTFIVWDAASGHKLLTIDGHRNLIQSVRFSSDAKRIVTASDDGTAMVWDAVTGKQLLVLTGHADRVRTASFSPDGKHIVTGSADNSIRVWDASTGEERLRLTGHTSHVKSVSYSHDGRTLVSGSDDGAVRLWDANSGQELYALITFHDGSWIVQAADGRFDSSDGAQPHFGHFVMDLPGHFPEVFEFGQVRTKDFYEPDLARKIMSGIYKPGEQPLRSQLPPPTVEELVEGNRVKFRVTDRFRGGIGQVRISVNGQTVKEFEPGSVTAGVWTTWDGQGLVARDAVVDVVADNSLETLASPRGSGLNAEATASKEPIRFVGVAMGVKDYIGSVASLKYAGADAVAMMRAMLALANSLGPNVRPELYLLTDEAVPDDLKGKVTVFPPAKANYTALVSKLKSDGKFTSNTLLFIDFSGHGVMVGDQYIYLTKDARTADPAQLKNEMATGVTMDEILSFLNLGLAGKRLLVLDTCQAAGAEKTLAANLKEGEGELDAQKRTVADWQNRYANGTQVLMGCPEGAASFEDPRFGHGLLTYSLLYSLRNDDLGDKPGDPEVLANLLIDHAARRTKSFAAELGLTQEAQPLGANSFPIGLMTKEARQHEIVLPNPKPAIGTCNLVDDTSDLPADAFNSAFVAQLESGARGGGVVHIASPQAPGVWTLSGHYRKGSDGKVTLQLRLTSPGQTPGKLPDLTTTVGDAVSDAYRAISSWLEAHSKP